LLLCIPTFFIFANDVLKLLIMPADHVAVSPVIHGFASLIPISFNSLQLPCFQTAPDFNAAPRPQFR
jgi:hypothetical protein